MTLRRDKTASFQAYSGLTKILKLRVFSVLEAAVPGHSPLLQIYTELEGPCEIQQCNSFINGFVFVFLLVGSQRGHAAVSAYTPRSSQAVQHLPNTKASDREWKG